MEFILIESKESGWLHTGLVKTWNGTYVLEGFFFDKTTYYQDNQKKLKIKEITITDQLGNIVLHENL